MTWVLAALLLLWWALGPLVPLVAIVLLAVPRVRWWVQDHWWLPGRVVRLAAAAVVVLAAVAVVAPDGWLPVPPAPGVLATPSYVGRPATSAPVAGGAVPEHPWLAAAGRGPAPGAHAGSTSPREGPLGLQPEVDTAWFGFEHCPRPGFDSRDRIIVTCQGRSGRSVHVVDPGTMRKVASRELPDPNDAGWAGGESCAATPYVLDERDRAVLATADRHVVALGTADGRGDPELSVDQEWDLRPYVPHGDCLVALAPDWGGRLWWASLGGLVGTIDRTSGEVRVHDLGGAVAGSFAVDETGGVHVASDAAVHRLVAGPDGTPQSVWRTPYPGEAPDGPTALAGTTPTLLDRGVLAVAASSDEGAAVLFLDRESGTEICRQPVFEEDGGAAGGALASLGNGVVVTNRQGYDGARSTLLGFATTPGLARVDLAGRTCRLRWTTDWVAPSAVATVSLADGLVHTYTKRPTWTGVSAWYVTALDARTGRVMWSARAGTGALMNSHHSALVLGPERTLWTATLGGLVRVRDRD